VLLALAAVEVAQTLQLLGQRALVALGVVDEGLATTSTEPRATQTQEAAVGVEPGRVILRDLQVALASI